MVRASKRGSWYDELAGRGGVAGAMYGHVRMDYGQAVSRSFVLLKGSIAWRSYCLPRGKGCAVVTDENLPNSGVWFRRKREPGRLGLVSVARLLVFELIQLTVFFLVVQQLWAMIVGIVLGVLGIVLTFGRWRGRWWTDSFLLWWRFRRRKGSSGERDADPRLTAVRELAPDLVIEDVSGAGDTPLGMGSDGAGWFAVLELTALGEDGIKPPVPFASLARVAAEAEQPGVVMQVVCHVVATDPARPAAEQRAPDPLGSTMPFRAPAATPSREQTLWVAVRLDANAVAESVIDDPDANVDIPSMLAEFTRRVGKVLKRRGIEARTLDSDELLDALTMSCDLVPTDRPVQPTEQWDSWRSGELTHGCFWLRTWPSAENGNTLLAAVTELPSAGGPSRTSLAFALEPGHSGTDLQCLIRLAAPADGYSNACARLVSIAERYGGEVFRLDGEHAAGVYASAPSGGGGR
ncbi:type VII secretion protein EccE [Tamaricihabitans halophyticus]|uniref:Type VII secretion protein EccE n=1 Tax=Tamaricihabitans halophyticus TaxID=1262583 RepID=A0A4R2R2B7_9PSEU|nr:type VII secretion protein EccE [Tamaricihabitans halophyticus]